MIEVHCNWKHLMNAGCTVSFSRVTYDDKYNIPFLADLKVPFKVVKQ